MFRDRNYFQDCFTFQIKSRKLNQIMSLKVYEAEPESTNLCILLSALRPNRLMNDVKLWLIFVSFSSFRRH